MRIEKILVTGRLYQAFAQELNQKLVREFRFLPDPAVSSADLRWADALVTFKPTPNFEFANLQWVHALGAGVDSFLFKKEWKEDVILTRTSSSFGRKISEYCLSYILRDLQLHDRFKKSLTTRTWQPDEPRTLNDQRIVVFGTGSIGQEVARTLAYFGADVSGVSLSGNCKEPFSRVVKSTQLENVLKHVDWLINTLPLTVKTENFFNKQIFDLLNNAVFINVGRGRSVDEQALLEALNKGKLRLAVLDVFREEPLPQDSILWERDDIIVTPHISAVTSKSEAIACFLDTLQRLDTGEALSNKVNIARGY